MHVAKTFWAQSRCRLDADRYERRLRVAASKVFLDLGAKMAILYREDGTDLNKPLVQDNGLWVRPSDFSVTRWGANESFWWNMLTTPKPPSLNRPVISRRNFQHGTPRARRLSPRSFTKTILCIAAPNRGR